MLITLVLKRTCLKIQTHLHLMLSAMRSLQKMILVQDLALAMGILVDRLHSSAMVHDTVLTMAEETVLHLKKNISMHDLALIEMLFSGLLLLSETLCSLIDN